MVVVVENNGLFLEISLVNISFRHQSAFDETDFMEM